MSEFMDNVAKRAAMREMNPLAFIRWRNELRQDYQQAFDPAPHKPATALGFGWLLSVLNDGSRVDIRTGGSWSQGALA